MVSSALRIRAVSAALALVAGMGLLAYEPAAPAANAADNELTDSAVTLSWSDGIVGADNSTVVEERDPEHFMYDDFDGLEVTVSQTDDIQAQAVDVTWSGWNPTPGTADFIGNYLQVMQCWGDQETGPLPENCVWGAEGMPLPGKIELGSLFRGVSASDPLAGGVPPHYQNPAGGVHVPFRPANAEDELVYPPNIETLFDRWTTNEVRGVRTDADGNGEAIFTVQNAIDAPHLGCGSPVEGPDQAVDGRDCWLVIVPHGMHQVGGTLVDPAATQDAQFADGSPLTPTLWNQRIQVQLDFAPVSGTCPVGAEQRATIGSELVAEAMFSWQPGLCAGDGATFSYLSMADSEGRRQVTSDVEGATGLAYTYSPVTPVEGGPEIVHAPVAVSGLAIALNIEELDGTVVRDVRLTPRLVAKLLTQSYLHDVPGGYQLFAGFDESEIPEWQVENPEDLSRDPEFTELNPEVPPKIRSQWGANMLRIAGPYPADAWRELWRWIQADDEAVAWLNGEPDEHGMVINPAYQELNLDEPPAPDSVLRNVENCYHNPESSIPEPGYCTLDLLPFATSFADSAHRARLGQSGNRADWDGYATSPSGGLGWWSEVDPQGPGWRWQLAVTDTASADLYSLPTASLRNAAGEFVQPDEANLAAGVEAMVPTDVDGVLQIDPETDNAAAYPLTMITYAAVREEQDEEALADYAALLTYAAGPGQTPGLAAGQLPPGYLPLNDDLRAQTLAVAEDLVTPDERDDPPGLNPNGPGGGDDGGTEGGGDGGVDGGDGGDDSGGGLDGTGADDGLPPGSGDAPDPAALAPNGGNESTGDPTQPPADGAAAGGPDDGTAPGVDDPSTPVAQSTPGEPIGPMQYALLVVLIVGLLGATAGPAVLKLGPRAA
ncbi:hypothetical protein [Jiangella alkaliphila]|uniref:Uncharacterized protein n=1 Tax=Jiangella alkaliphila TaxID=419479 RepID=A0A1H2LJ20_9ACTN|nr:hypothetical protein [Jiangella alkaliphila]SDU81010.1 hypothetical protein SAMN04488563_6256 [Jiangella alkaliphila]